MELPSDKLREIKYFCFIKNVYHVSSIKFKISIVFIEFSGFLSVIIAYSFM